MASDHETTAAATPVADPAPPGRWWARFSLESMLVVIGLVSAFLGGRASVESNAIPPPQTAPGSFNALEPRR